MAAVVATVAVQVRVTNHARHPTRVADHWAREVAGKNAPHRKARKQRVAQAAQAAQAATVQQIHRTHAALPQVANRHPLPRYSANQAANRGR